MEYLLEYLFKSFDIVHLMYKKYILNMYLTINEIENFSTIIVDDVEFD